MNVQSPDRILMLHLSFLWFLCEIATTKCQMENRKLSRLKKHTKVLLLILFMRVLFMNLVMEISRFLCLVKHNHYKKTKLYWLH